MQEITNLKDFADLIEHWSGELLNYIDVLKEQFPDSVVPLSRIEQGIAHLPFENNPVITTDFYDN